MPRYQVAHIKEQGVDLIIIPLGAAFGSLGGSAQNAQQQELQIRATASGLAGTVVPVWEMAGNHMGFLAPTRYQQFFSSINMPYVLANLDREIYW